MAYCTVSNVSSYLGETIDGTTTPNETQVGEFIDRATSEIDSFSGTSFESQTATDELYDYDEYSTSIKEPQLEQIDRIDGGVAGARNVIKLNNYPIISVTTLQVNQGSTESADWKTLTEGTDFIKYTDEGVIVFLRSDALPVENYQGIKITYEYGHNSVPLTVERLCILMTVKEIIRTKINNSSYNSIDSISIETISISKSTGESVQLMNSLQDEINMLKKEIVGMTNYWIV